MVFTEALKGGANVRRAAANLARTPRNLSEPDADGGTNSVFFQGMQETHGAVL